MVTDTISLPSLYTTQALEKKPPRTTVQSSKSAEPMALVGDRGSVDSQGAQTEGLQLDEPCCIFLVVQTTIVLKGCDLLVVQTVGRFAAHHHHIALQPSLKALSI